MTIILLDCFLLILNFALSLALLSDSPQRTGLVCSWSGLRAPDRAPTWPLPCCTTWTSCQCTAWICPLFTLSAPRRQRSPVLRYHMTKRRPSLQNQLFRTVLYHNFFSRTWLTCGFVGFPWGTAERAQCGVHAACLRMVGDGEWHCEEHLPHLAAGCALLQPRSYPRHCRESLFTAARWGRNTEHTPELTFSEPRGLPSIRLLLICERGAWCF